MLMVLMLMRRLRPTKRYHLWLRRAALKMLTRPQKCLIIKKRRPTMTRYAEMMKIYLKDKDPKKYKDLRLSGELLKFCEQKATAARAMEESLIKSGMMDFEAEEIARSEMFSL
ncbi:MAG TPA: hypothetical protein DEQ20_00545 [Desulfobulbaceae bacterium]|nr:hypothetical protein [Desulfobulbaceae bacterium]